MFLFNLFVVQPGFYQCHEDVLYGIPILKINHFQEPEPQIRTILQNQLSLRAIRSIYLLNTRDD